LSVGSGFPAIRRCARSRSRVDIHNGGHPHFCWSLVASRKDAEQFGTVVDTRLSDHMCIGNDRHSIPDDEPGANEMNRRSSSLFQGRDADNGWLDARDRSGKIFRACTHG
jgi:hypothetical protein